LPAHCGVGGGRTLVELADDVHLGEVGLPEAAGQLRLAFRGWGRRQLAPEPRRPLGGKVGPWTLDPDALRPMVAGAVEEEFGGVDLERCESAK